MIGIENLTKRYTEHLATLVESGFYHATEQLLVATQIGHLVTRHGDSAKRRVALFLRHSLEIDACDIIGRTSSASSQIVLIIIPVVILIDYL